MTLIDQYNWSRQYLEARLGAGLRRAVDDEQGSATAEQIVMIGAAVVGAAVVAAILWAKLTDGANSVQTPSP